MTNWASGLHFVLHICEGTEARDAWEARGTAGPTPRRGGLQTHPGGTGQGRMSLRPLSPAGEEIESGLEGKAMPGESNAQVHPLLPPDSASCSLPG